MVEKTIQLFHGTIPQQQHLLARINDMAREILDLDFSEADHDQSNIRRFIYLQGRLAAFNELYEDAYQAPEIPPAPESRAQEPPADDDPSRTF